MQSHSKKKHLALKKNYSYFVDLKPDTEVSENDEIQNNSVGRIPTLSELLSNGCKYSNDYLLKCLINSQKENEELKREIMKNLKEIKKLEQLNNYLVVSHQNRDKMITDLNQENKTIKNVLKQFQNAEFIKKTSETSKFQASFPWWTPVKSNEKKIECSNSSSLPYLNTSKNGKQRDSIKIQHQKKSSPIFMESSISKEEKNPAQNSKIIILNHSQAKTSSRIREEKMTHEYILNMNIINQKDSFKSYQEISTIKFLHPILEEEDFFITYVTGSDFSSLITLYDNLFHLYTDHRTLYSLVFRLKKIIKACNSMTETLVLSEAMERIVDETCECLECDRASVFMLDEQKEELWTKAAKGTKNTIRIPMNKGIVGSALTSGKAVNILNAYADDRFNKEVDLKTNYKTNTILCLPILDSRGRNVGVIQAINKFNGYFTKDDEGLLSILANLAGIVLRNSISYDEQLLFHNSLRHILKAGIEINSLFSFINIIPKAENILKNAMNVDKAKIFILQKNENEEIQLLHYQDETKMQTFDGNCGIAGYTATTGTVQILPNAYNNSLFNGQIDIETSMPLICMPITHPKIANEVLGVIEILYTKGIQGLSAFHKSKINHQDYEILEFFSQQLAQTILNNHKWEEIKSK